MDELKTYRVSGWSALAFVVLALAQFPLYSQGDASVSFYNGAAIALDFARIHVVVFLRILLDLGLYVVSMVFAATFSHLIKRARPEYGWAGTLVFGATGSVARCNPRCEQHGGRNRAGYAQQERGPAGGPGPHAGNAPHL